MTSRWFLVVGAMLMVLGLALIGCGSEQQADRQDSGSAGEISAAEAYPLDWCLVSGEALGKMGDRVVQEYKGRKFEFCCQQCVKIFQADPGRYLAKLDSAVAANQAHPGPGSHGDGHDSDGHDGHTHGT